MRKTESPKMVSKRLYLHYLRSYERFMYFSQTWNLTIAKNTNVNQRKSKNHEELNFSREKVQKYEKNWKSKNDFKSRLRALNKELWAIYVFFQTWNLTITKNTNVTKGKSKIMINWTCAGWRVIILVLQSTSY